MALAHILTYDISGNNVQKSLVGDTAGRAIVMMADTHARDTIELGLPQIGVSATELIERIAQRVVQLIKEQHV